jgi:hypothetical protein
MEKSVHIRLYINIIIDAAFLAFFLETTKSPTNEGDTCLALVTHFGLVVTCMCDSEIRIKMCFLHLIGTRLASWKNVETTY